MLFKPRLLATRTKLVGLRNRALCSTAALNMHQECLAYKTDSYGGVIVDELQLPEDPVEFRCKLEGALKTWVNAGVRGVWMKLPLSHAHLVGPAVQEGGFRPHHAGERHIMLVRWLAASPCTLPLGATHQVGVGAFVLNEQQQVLMVMERNGPLKGKAVWKLPTGLCNEAEDVPEAAEREVLEETGIRARFDCMLAVRQAHGFALGHSDLFVVVAMRAEAGQLGSVVAQEEELEAAQWMSLEDYAQQPFLKGVALYDKIRERCLAYAAGRYRGFHAARLE
ncbi:NUDIX hydrolase domain-like protein [Haematococcus lacustris]